MKRSQINNWLLWAKRRLQEAHISLPDFAGYTPGDWQGKDISTIRATMLGWDITDFGSGEFEKLGAVLITLRNGQQCENGLGTPYAEKLILIPDGGRLPIHFHYTKTEDIINRGGGTLWVKLFNAREDDSLDEENDVQVFCDGLKKTVKAGEIIEISRGNSITLTPRVYHTFGAKDGDLIAGEVSSINDDNIDNKFAEAGQRFTEIEEDAPPIHLLCNEYEKMLK